MKFDPSLENSHAQRYLDGVYELNMEEEAGEDPRELNELVIERGTYLKKKGLLNITNLRSDPKREKDIEKRLTMLR